MRLSIVASLLFFSFFSAFGQEITFKAYASNKVVEVGERFRITFELKNAQGTGFKMPAMDGITVLSRPSVSRSSSMSSVNGKMTSTSSENYSVVVEIRKEGRFTVAPASVFVDGKEYKSNTLIIESVKSSAAAGNKRKGSGVAADDLFVRMSVSKTHLYVGEPFVLTLKLYTRVDIGSLSINDDPAMSGFYSQDFGSPNRYSLKREVVDGAIYNSVLMKRVLLYPQKSGEIIIDPYKIDCGVKKVVSTHPFWGEQYETVNTILKSNKVSLNVKRLPDGAPKGFTGAVGNFTIRAKADPLEIDQHEAITLNVTVRGTGNMKLIDNPVVNIPPDFETYDPKVKDNFKNTSAGAKGTKKYEYLLVARHPGDYEIPSIEFAYFDPKSKSYKVSKTEPIAITVKRVEGASTGGSTVQTYSKEQLKVLGSDIRFIKTGNLNLEKPSAYVAGSWKMWLLYGLPLVLFAVVFFMSKRNEEENKNVALVKNKNASKISKKRLKVAASYLKADNKDAFYEEVVRALWGYIANKLTIPVAELNKDNVSEKLKQAGVSPESIQQLIDVLNKCEFARFAPSASSDMSDLYSSAEQIINDLEAKLK